MSGWTVLFLAVGTLGVEHAAERRWPTWAFLPRFTTCLIWAAIWSIHGATTAAWISFAAAGLVLALEATQLAPRPARRPQHHRVSQANPYPTARPLRRVP